MNFGLSDLRQAFLFVDLRLCRCLARTDISYRGMQPERHRQTVIINFNLFAISCNTIPKLHNSTTIFFCNIRLSNYNSQIIWV